MAAPVFDAASKGTEVNAATISWTHVVGSGANRVLVVGVLMGGTQSVTSATWNTSESLTKLASAANSNGDVVEIWYRVAPGSGSHTITVNISGTIHLAAGAASYTGASQATNPFGTPVTATGSSTTASATVTSTDATMTIISMFGDAGAGNQTAGTGVTQRWIDTTYSNGSQGDKAGAAGSTAISWSLSPTDSWVNLAVALNTAITTSSRTIPTTAVLLVTSARTITSTVVLLQTSARTIPATAALLQTQSRTIPTTASLSGNTRTIPTTAALLQTSTRTITTTTALASLRTIPTVAALLQPNNTRTITTTAALLQTNVRTISTTAALLQTKSRTITTSATLAALRTIPTVAALLQTNTRTITSAAALLQPNNARTITAKAALLQTKSRTITTASALSTPPLASGRFAVWANGTGAVQVDSFRGTQYPDPALSLAPIIPRLGASSVAWNALTPTNTTLGVDVSPDGVNWTDITANNGNPIAGLFVQPDPTTDGFDLDTSANYTSTNRTGGSACTPFFDVLHSRLSLTGGTNALYLYSAISDNDVDFFVDMDQSDAGGIVWRFVDASNFYYLQIADSLASTGTRNLLTLSKVLSNARSTLSTAPITYSVGTPGDAYTATFTRGTYHRFRVSMLLGVITVYVDGVQMISYTDVSPLGVGKMGLYNNGGTVGSRYYQLWMVQIGDYVSGNPAQDIVTSDFVYTRLRLATTDPSVSPQVEDIATLATNPDIAMGTTIPNITYNSTFISANFDDLAKQSNYGWYFKPDRTAVFRAMSVVAAPWILQSSIAGLVETVDIEVDTNLELDVANDLYRNRQTILGAQDTITPPPAIYAGDGQSTTVTLGYPLASAPTITLNGIAQVVGLKGSTGADWYYALGDPVIEQDSAGVVLQATDRLSVKYTGLYDIIVTVDDTVEQAARALIEGGTGITESVEDHTGEGLLRNAAITLAAQLINRYAIAGRTLIFDTSRDGLEVGQTLTIFLPEHGLWDAQLIINTVEITLRQGINNTQVYWYKVTCSELPKQSTWSKLIAAGLGLS